jgi:hypothetical protein
MKSALQTSERFEHPERLAVKPAHCDIRLSVTELHRERRNWQINFKVKLSLGPLKHGGNHTYHRF